MSSGIRGFGGDFLVELSDLGGARSTSGELNPWHKLSYAGTFGSFSPAASIIYELRRAHILALKAQQDPSI